jgi:guanine deaminase
MQEPKQEHMREAIRLSIENVESGKGGPFGAVVVKDGVIIARGANEVTSSNDPTAHAEVVAIRKACAVLGSFQLADCEIFCSCEPCPMCLGAIYWARPKAIYYANTKSDAASIDFDDAFIYAEIARPVEERTLFTRQMMRDEALGAFEKWKASPLKTGY